MAKNSSEEGQESSSDQSNYNSPKDYYGFSSKYTKNKPTPNQNYLALNWGTKLNLAFPTCHRRHPGPHSHSSRLLHGCAVHVCSCIRSSTRPPPPPAPSWLASSLQRALQPVRGFKKGNEFEESEKLQMIKGKGNVLSENTFT